MTLADAQNRIERALVAEHVRTAGYDVARKGRLQAIFILIFLSLPLTFLVVGAIGGEIPAPAMIAMLIEIAVLSGALAILKTRGWLAVSGNTFVGMFFTVSCISIATAGGLGGTSPMWLLLAPLMALLLVGARSGLAWFGMMVLAMAGLASAHHRGWVAAQDLDLDAQLFNTSVNVVLCTVVAMVCALLFEQAKRRMLADVDRAREELDRALRGSRMVLDHIDEALLVVGRDGTVNPQRSAAVTRLLGPIRDSDTLWAVVARTDARSAAWLELGWSDLFADVLPQEVIIEQLPRRIRAGAQVLDVSYAMVPGEVDRVLVIARDVTHIIAAERAQEEERELVSLLARRSRDEATFRIMWAELWSTVVRIGGPGRAAVDVARDLHTLKGNAGILELTALARLCHDAESRAAEAGVGVTDDDAAAIASHVENLAERFASLVSTAADAVTVERSEYDELLGRAIATAPDGELTRTLRSWTAPRLLPQLGVLADRAAALGRRLGKGDLHVVVTGDDARTAPDLQPLLASLTHLLGNAVDHGLETVEERVMLGKTRAGTLRVSSRSEPGALVLEVTDDGRGIDWDALARRAEARGLRASTTEQRIEALFADGVSSRTEVTEVSGRGVGLAAVRTAVRAVGGAIDVESEPGKGTTFRLRVPRGASAATGQGGPPSGRSRPGARAA